MLEKIIGVIIIYSSISVIVSRSDIKALMSLVMIFIGISIIGVMNRLEFIGIMMIMVYVGAVAILFLFVIMMTGEEERGVEVEEVRKIGLVMVVGVMIISYISKSRRGMESNIEVSVEEVTGVMDMIDNVRGVGVVLYEESMYNVVVVGIILLLGMIGGMKLGRR